jgi:hypothetical protein
VIAPHWLKANIWMSDWNHLCVLVLLETEYFWRTYQWKHFLNSFSKHVQTTERSSRWLNYLQTLYLAIFGGENYLPTCSPCLLLNQGKETKGGRDRLVQLGKQPKTSTYTIATLWWFKIRKSLFFLVNI